MKKILFIDDNNELRMCEQARVDLCAHRLTGHGRGDHAHEADQRLSDDRPADRGHRSRNLAEAPLMNEMTTVTTAKDWASDQEVRWCPGCGDYAVLKAVQRTMARVRCELPPEQVNDGGMPVSTAELDEFEDRLIEALEAAGAQTYEIAVVTGDGHRDLWFAAEEGDELREAIKAVPGQPSFALKLARIDGPRDGLLNSLTAPR